jgi:hypothetical protein
MEHISSYDPSMKQSSQSTHDAATEHSTNDSAMEQSTNYSAMSTYDSWDQARYDSAIESAKDQSTYPQSTYDSIINIRMPGFQWQKVPDGPLEELHRKFWRKGLKEWPGNGSVDVDEDEDTEAEEDEIGPCTGVLNIGIEGLWRQKIWVRKEYIRLYNYCSVYMEYGRTKDLPPSMVITGQPGIGKCFTL